MRQIGFICWQEMTKGYIDCGGFRRILTGQRQRGSTGWSASSEPQRFTRFFCLRDFIDRAD
jgi:hypothetical protein